MVGALFPKKKVVLEGKARAWMQGQNKGLRAGKMQMPTVRCLSSPVQCSTCHPVHGPSCRPNLFPKDTPNVPVWDPPFLEAPPLTSSQFQVKSLF